MIAVVMDAELEILCSSSPPQVQRELVACKNYN